MIISETGHFLDLLLNYTFSPGYIRSILNKKNSAFNLNDTKEKVGKGAFLSQNLEYPLLFSERFLFFNF